MLVDYCSPTLAGIKTGSLFTVYEGIGTRIIHEICEFNRILYRFGIKAVCLRHSPRSTLVYVYRRNALSRDWQSPLAQQMLRSRGYPCDNTERSIAMLGKHVCSDEEFPHEIGLFLGYPPSDVQAFIDHPCSGVKCVGCWKSFTNPEECKRLTDSYNKCTETWRNKMSMGFSLEQLLVSLAA